MNEHRLSGPRLAAMLRAVAADYLTVIGYLAATVVLTPVLLHRLGQEGYGLWSIVASLTIQLGLLDLGLSTATAKFVAEYRANGEGDLLRQVVSSAAMLYAIICGVVVAVGLAMSPFVGTLFGVSAALRHDAQVAVILAGLFLAVWLPMMGVRGVIMGYQRIDFANLVVALGTVGLACLAGLVVAAGGGLVGAMIARLAVALGVSALLAATMRRLSPRVEFGLRYFRGGMVRLMLAFGFWAFIPTTASVLVYQVGVLLVGAVLKVKEVSPFSIVLSVVYVCLSLTMRISDSLVAPFAHMEARSEAARVRRAFLELSRASAAVAGIFTVVLLFFGRQAVAVWVGPGSGTFAGMATLAVLTALLPLQGLVHPGVVMLVGTGKAKQVASVSVCQVLIMVALSLALVGPIGVLGVALGMVIALVASSFWYVPRLCLAQLGVSAGEYLRKVVAPAVVTGVATASVAWAVTKFVPAEGVVSLILRVALTGSAYAVLYVAMFTSNEDRRLYGQTLLECITPAAGVIR